MSVVGGVLLAGALGGVKLYAQNEAASEWRVQAAKATEASAKASRDGRAKLEGKLDRLNEKIEAAARDRWTASQQASHESRMVQLLAAQEARADRRFESLEERLRSR